MREKKRWVVLFSFFALAIFANCSNGLPVNFTDKAAIPGLNLPTVVQFAADGSVVMGEKGGLVKFFRSVRSSVPYLTINLTQEVYNYWDRGLLGLALHPDFPHTPELWVLYNHDAVFGEASDGPIFNDEPNGNRPTSAVLAKLTVNFETTPFSVSSEVLIEDWCTQFPSHSIGTLSYSKDEDVLYVSAGDTASFNEADWGQLNNICGDPENEGGALRSQDLETPGDPVTLDGTILRLNPDTGEAALDNPLVFANNDPSDDRIIAYGARNPYRMTQRPGSSQIWIGDVGWNLWEEINVIQDPKDNIVENFGWPCYEGAHRTAGYDHLPICKNLYARESELSMKGITPFFEYEHALRRPIISIFDAFENPCAGITSSVTGIAFYQGGEYPNQYDGKLFFTDYSRKCIWTLNPDAPVQAMKPHGEGAADIFYSRMNPAVDLKVGPGGDLYYVAIDKGSLQRIRYGHPDEQDTNEADPLAPLVTITDPLTTITAEPGTVVTFAGYAVPGGVEDKKKEEFKKLKEVIPDTSYQWRITVEHCSSEFDCHSHFLNEYYGVKNGQFIMPSHELPAHVQVKLIVTVTEGDQVHIGEQTARVNLPGGAAAKSFSKTQN